MSDLVRLLQNFEYKKGKDGHEVKATFLAATIEDTKKKVEFDNSTDEQVSYISPNPKQAVLDAYKRLETAAEGKLSELDINLSNERFKNSPLQFLIYKGAFSPSIESALQDMLLLRNQVAHYTEDKIPKVDAQSYVSVASKIEKTIEALDRLPAMNLHAITMIVRNLSILLDSGKHGNVTIEDVHRHIEDGSILQFISGFEEARELQGALESDLWRGFDRFYTQSLQSIFYGYAGDERRKWGIQNSGICLLLAWTNEIIQMGSGWHPTTNLSELDEAQTQ